MPDITMCLNKDCPIRTSCYRFTATPSDNRQAYAEFEFRETENLRGCTHYINNGERCGDCETCKWLEKVKKSVLKAANPPFSHVDQGVVDLWNQELQRLPCLRIGK